MLESDNERKLLQMESDYKNLLLHQEAENNAFYRDLRMQWKLEDIEEARRNRIEIIFVWIPLRIAAMWILNEILK